MSNPINKYLITGGVGDFIQYLDAVEILNSLKCEFIVVTHFKGAKAFFEKHAKIEKFTFHHFDDVKTYSEILSSVKKDNILECPRSPYLTVDYPYKVESPFDNDNEIIGIHPFGSNFSKNAYASFNLPEKKISVSCVEKILRKDKNYLIFGSEKELLEYDHLKDEANICLVNHPDIWVCLSHVQFCKKIIAVDSSIKAFSLARKIPTYLIVGDFEDQTRDYYFINPYLNSGFLELLKTKNPVQDEESIIKFVNEAVYKDC
jgi:hypothetical protein